jgi:hypothetical protein
MTTLAMLRQPLRKPTPSTFMGLAERLQTHPRHRAQSGRRSQGTCDASGSHCACGRPLLPSIPAAVQS